MVFPGFPISYFMNGAKSPKIEAVKVVNIWSIQGNVRRNTTKIAITRGAKEKV